MGRRAGRKRKEGKRYPSGQLKPVIKPDDVLRVRTSRQPHRRAMKDELRTDERAGSVIGRLFLAGDIDAECYDALMRYAVIVGQYRSMIEAPRSTAGGGKGFECCANARADSAEFLKTLFGPDMVVTAETPAIDPDTCACLKRKQKYDDAYEAVLGWRRADTERARQAIALLFDGAPEALLKAVARADATTLYQGSRLQDQMAARAIARALNEQEVPDQELVHLVRGSRRLVAHFGLTDARALAHSRNAH